MINKKLFVSLVAIALLFGFIGGLIYGKTQALPDKLGKLITRAVNQPDNVDFAQFWEVWNSLHNDYVDKAKLKDKDLLYGAIDGLVRAVGDPYTVFLPPVESKKFLQEINGAFSGIGIEVGIRNKVLTVVAPIKDTPAQKAGLLAGDKILKIGDKSTDSIKIDEAVSLIRGPKGTSVTLSILHNGGQQPKIITITRDNIKIPSVDLTVFDDDTAHLQLFVFNQNIDNEFDRVAKEIKKSKAKRIILDLRNNPGGLLDSAVNIASYFLDSGLVVTTEKFANGTQNPFQARANGMLKGYPLVILMNKGSASASEILAGALKDHRNIKVIGEKSFGKGSVQQVKDLAEGASLKVTVAKWFTPKDYSISEQGILADIEIVPTEADIAAGKDPQLDKAKEIVKNLK